MFTLFSRRQASDENAQESNRDNNQEITLQFRSHRFSTSSALGMFCCSQKDNSHQQENPSENTPNLKL